MTSLASVNASYRIRSALRAESQQIQVSFGADVYAILATQTGLWERYRFAIDVGIRAPSGLSL